jgi:uncharacterized protein YbjT (DUF2867 family)
VRIVVFGATGMIGHGVLSACLAASDVTEVVAIGRGPTGRSDPKLREIAHRDLAAAYADDATADAELASFDACFFPLGVSSLGMSEADYTRMTYDLALAIATPLACRNPRMTFVYVSGMGTDTSEKGRSMWARVKGRTENALQRLPFEAVYLFRFGVVQAVDGARSRIASYRAAYVVIDPILALCRRFGIGHVLTTTEIGRAMLEVARHGAPKSVLESPDIERIARHR